MTVKQITLEEFQRHCAEELKHVAMGERSLRITTDGRVIAVVARPEAKVDTSPPLSKLMGSLRGNMTPGEIESFDHPTFAPEDWEEHPADLNNE